MRLRSVRELSLEGRRVLMRADFNVPLDGTRITDDSRIRAALPTMRHILDEGAALILMSHLGRPGGKPDPALSLRPVAGRLAELLDRDVPLAPDSVGPEVARLAGALGPGQVLLLENTRFHLGEECNDGNYARELAGLADCFVNDAFGTVHRGHASTVGVARQLPAAAGLLVEREVAVLSRLLEKPERPYLAILGGAKVRDKLALIDSLLTRADRILVGGAIANTLLRAAGHELGDSLVEEKAVDHGRRLLEKAGDALVLPRDLIISRSPDETAGARTIPVGDVPEGWRVVDIGEATLEHWEELLDDTATVVWNGPVGLFEVPAFAGSTVALAATLADLEAFVVVGGGDTVAALHQAGVTDRIDHVSTGGGAMLRFLQGEVLPGLDVLRGD